MSYFKYQDKFIFYEEYGQGEPIIFLHGNTASSKMSEFLMPLYAENFRCILIDFLGNGQSDRVENFSPDMWHDEALQTIALTEHLLIGTSGGAWAAVNAALERPDLFHAVVADSFDGRTLNENFSANLLSERKAAKEDTQSRQFYELCQGADWEKVVDLDTEALLKCAEEKRPLFHKPLEELKTPILFMGSREDESCRNNMEEEYREMASMLSQSSVYLFPKGGHPSLFSNAEEAAMQIKKFISQALFGDYITCE
mgnify:FL=1